jgi:hypothetical protein
MAFPDEQLRVSCACGGEEISVGWNKEFPEEIDMCFWQIGRPSGGRSLTYVLRQIVQLLKEGHPYTDMVILNNEEARKLGQKLIELADKAVPKEKSE